MTLLDSFSKPGWQHKKPEVRKAAIEELGDEAILLELIQGDPEPEIRALALSRINSSSVLDELCETLSPPLQNQARTQRLSQLLPDPAKIAVISDDAVLIRIASLSDEPELVAASISQVQSMPSRMELAASHPLAKIRLCAARGIDDIDLLKELMQQSKHKDKSVFRYCKEKVDQHNAEERVNSERQQQIRQLAEDARQLSSSVDSPEFRARFLTLEHRWAGLSEHADPESSRKIGDDLEISAKRIERLSEAREAEHSRQGEIEAAKQTFSSLVSELEGMDLSDLDLNDSQVMNKLAKDLDGIENRWLATLHVTQPTSAQTSECKQQLNHWRAIAQAAARVLSREPALNKLHEDAAKLDKSDYMAFHKHLGKVENQIKKLPWPDSVSAVTPATILKLHELQTHLQKRLTELKKEEKKTLDQLETAFEELHKELDDNHFKNADRLHNRIRNLVRHLSPNHQDHFHHELRPLTARLSEIHDWQGFAIEPKKIELCERMAALVGTTESPDILATRIKALQEEWKALGPLSPRRDQELWRTFHAAAEEAYAPCKQAFAQLATVRKDNLRRRMELVAQLTDYDQRMAWPDAANTDQGAAAPDWKMVQKTLDTARTAFNEISPVSGKGEQKSRKALQVICDRIYSHIKKEYEQNIARKKELVDQVKSMVELENLRDAIDGTKGLQREWKNVGMTPRQVDRRLWHDFRSACDAVFARLDEERKQQNAARNEQQEQFKAAKAAQVEAAKQRALKEQQRWPCLLEKMQACALKAQDEPKATELWEKEGDIPRGIDNEALQAWWEKGSDEKLSEDAVRQACIGIEILAGIDSPAEDKQARMAYQMQRLVDGMGSAGAQGSKEDQLLEQVNGFLALKPTGEWLERFTSSVKINPGKA